ncbi:ubiquinone/menaquinone biosynthesis C-methylase UbiE [Rhizobium sp. BK313]|uniref:class I SAM-dependent methyltransferase n=1 Tax=Rhizobium sp. BK313 TaxID=2587081 RepID=UPI00105FA318|nr:methyltransferase domain-containing protein [Rhizobium sp. BK313]MBB3458812.1 ubiquinone/menaquinone biosynthesis C-methylase UbiE [Rhizobium sp. BK313]
MTSLETAQDQRWSVFDALAPTYQARPDYLDDALDRLDTLLGDRRQARLMIDVGAGTGIFTRQLARHYSDAEIIGLEPNAPMREIADRTRTDNVRYTDAQASALPFADRSVAVVAAASALHRFDRPTFYAEASRVLQPGGILMIIDNLPRPWGARFHNAYLAYQEAEVPAYRRGRNSDGFGGYIDLDPVGDLNSLPQFDEVSYGLWPFDDYLDQERLMALVQSSSINRSAMNRVGREAFLDQIRMLYRTHADSEGLVRMSFVTIAVFGHHTKI